MFSLLKEREQVLEKESEDCYIRVKPFINGIGAQQKCFDRGDRYSDTFYVVKQLPYKGGFTNTYNSFKDIETFLKFRKDNEDGPNCFNELIREDRPCVEYYDLDGKWSDGWSSIDEYILEFLKLRSRYSESTLNIINKEGVRYDDLIITQACNEKKLSLHIIIRKHWYFNSTSDQRTWANSFSDWIKEKYPDSKISIDTSVYNKNSIMRCVGSCKVDDLSRPFRPYGLSKKIKDERLFYCSYVEKFFGVVGEVSYMYLPLTVPSQKVETPLKEFPELTSSEELDTCKAIVKILKQERSDVYNDWFAIGSALHTVLNGSEEGLILFKEFSSRSSKYVEKNCENLWGKFKGEYKKGTLIYYFNKDNPRIRRR